MSIDDEITNIKRELDSINVKKIQNATVLQRLENEKNTLLEECQALGVDPKKIEEEVSRQEALLTAEIKDIQTQLESIHVPV